LDYRRGGGHYSSEVSAERHDANLGLVLRCEPPPPAGESITYGAAGNITNDGMRSDTYDAENRMKAVAATAATYTHSGHGLRVKKQVGGSDTADIFSNSKVIAEYSGGLLSRKYICRRYQKNAELVH
jgi:hypothetical protein